MKYFLFDTNILLTDEKDSGKMYFFKTSNRFRNFLNKTKQEEEYKILFSQIVKLEIIKHQQETISKIVKGFKENERILAPTTLTVKKQLGGEELSLELKKNLTEEEIKNFLDEYREYLENVFTNFISKNSIFLLPEIINNGEYNKEIFLRVLNKYQNKTFPFENPTNPTIDILTSILIEEAKPNAEKLFRLFIEKSFDLAENKSSKDDLKDAIILEGSIIFAEENSSDEIYFITEDKHLLKASEKIGMPNNLKITDREV